ncbi:MAG: BREX-2 system phosphatase PglZ, partial [Pseudonocardia sp.]
MVEALLRIELPRARDRRLVLVHARYAPGAAPRFPVEVDGATRPVEVRDEQSVLGIVDAWQAHQRHGGDGVLVVTTGVPDDMLGWDLRGHAVGRGTLTVDRGEIVKHRFGARELDPRVRQAWLLDALLDAEPAEGWSRSGPVLTRDTAVRALLRARLGIDDDALDPGSLLEWSQANGRPARFADLPAAEQEGMRDWLQENVGGVAAVLAPLLVEGRAADAMALGIIARILGQPRVSADVAVAVGGLLGGVQVRPEQRHDFVAAVEGTLERWVSAAENGGDAGEPAHRRLVAVVDRADALAAQAGLTEQLADDPYLPSSFRNRLHAVAATLIAEPDGTAVAMADGALRRLREHRLARLHPQRCAAAEMAVRLLRWLATPASAVSSVSAGVTEHLRSGGW